MARLAKGQPERKYPHAYDQNQHGENAANNQNTLRVPDIAIVIKSSDWKGLCQSVRESDGKGLIIARSFNDPTTAHDFIAIKNSCLSRRDRALRFVENNVGAVICERCDFSPRGGVPVANADFRAWFLRIVKRDQLTPAAVNSLLNSSSDEPTVTRFDQSIEITYNGRSSAMPIPRRCPIV